MKSNQKNIDNIHIMAEAYTEFVDRLNRLDNDSTYSIDDIKLELSNSFKIAAERYLKIVIESFEKKAEIPKTEKPKRKRRKSRK